MEFAAGLWLSTFWCRFDRVSLVSAWLSSVLWGLVVGWCLEVYLSVFTSVFGL